MLKNSVLHKKIYVILPVQCRIWLKHSSILELFQCEKGQGASLNWTPVIPQMASLTFISSSITDINTWDYFGKYFIKYYNIELHSQTQFQTLLCRKLSCKLTLSNGRVDFSGLGGIWIGPSHSRNMYCGHSNQCYSDLLWKK